MHFYIESHRSLFLHLLILIELYFAFLSPEPSSISHPFQGQLGKKARNPTGEFPEEPGNWVLSSVIWAWGVGMLACLLWDKHF